MDQRHEQLLDVIIKTHQRKEESSDRLKDAEKVIDAAIIWMAGGTSKTIGDLRLVNSIKEWVRKYEGFRLPESLEMQTELQSTDKCPCGCHGRSLRRVHSHE